MNIYWLTLIISSAFAALAAADKYFRKSTYIFFIVVLIIISSIRYKTGYDFDNYVEIYKTASLTESNGSEIGWLLTNTLLKLFTNEPTSIFIFSSIMIYGTIGLLLYKESKFAAIAMLAFMVNIPFYWESLAIIRQYIAISLTLLASFSWINGNKKNYYVFFIFAVLFHFTAIIAITFPLLCKWKSRWTFILFFTLAAILLSHLIEELIYSFSAFEKYQAYFDGRIASEGKEKSGTVVYIRIIIALFLVFSVDKINYLPELKKNLISNSIFFGYVLFYVLYESLALRRVAQFFIIYEIFAIGYIAEAVAKSQKSSTRLLFRFLIFIYIATSLILLIKDVWLNPIGKQDDSQLNYEYRTIINR